MNYVGSITIDEDLLDASGILEYERVLVANVTSGSRFETYVIKGERGSGVICINGAAAHLAHVDDIVIIFSFTWLEHEKAKNHSPRIVLVNEKNKIIG